MKKAPSVQEWMEDFKEFLNVESAKPPMNAQDAIFSRVHSELNPIFWNVFMKLLGIHAVAGATTLLFCPQFGFSLTSGMGLQTLFSHFGDQACMMSCGAIFTGGSFLIASLLLRPEEVRAIRRNEILQASLVALLSIGLFVCMGASLIIGLGVFWVLGSALGAIGTFEFGYAFRMYIQKKRYS